MQRFKSLDINQWKENKILPGRSSSRDPLRHAAVACEVFGLRIENSPFERFFGQDRWKWHEVLHRILHACQKLSLLASANAQGLPRSLGLHNSTLSSISINPMDYEKEL